MRKTYTHQEVTYGSTGKKWIFARNEHGLNREVLRTFFAGGAETAHKVARAVSGSLKRTKGIGLDNLGRANIATIETAAEKASVDA